MKCDLCGRDFIEKILTEKRIEGDTSRIVVCHRCVDDFVTNQDKNKSLLFK
ncbi:hypothetical protein HZA33_04555 [Candidatus Pacearchaeota archaeon]|nr:hypothetical protein [Candidatus Pacearchaeota archaeon]